MLDGVALDKNPSHICQSEAQSETRPGLTRCTSAPRAIYNVGQRGHFCQGVQNTTLLVLVPTCRNAQPSHDCTSHRVSSTSIHCAIWTCLNHPAQGVPRATLLMQMDSTAVYKYKSVFFTARNLTSRLESQLPGFHGRGGTCTCLKPPYISLAYYVYN